MMVPEPMRISQTAHFDDVPGLMRLDEFRTVNTKSPLLSAYLEYEMVCSNVCTSRTHLMII
jgi:hypothetical protein